MHTFVKLLLSSPSHVIVQLTAPVESGVKKSDPYLPTQERPSTLASPRAAAGEGEIVLRWLGQDWHEAEKATVTSLEVSSGGQTKTVTHVYFAGWKDKGVPEGREGLETLLR